MIEREAPIRIYNEILANTLGAKGAKGRLVRVAPEGFYEVTLESQGKNYTSLLPIQSTVILAAEAEEEVAAARGGALMPLRMRVRLKVVHVGLGPIGQGIARLVLETDGLQVVGADRPLARPGAARTSAPCWGSAASCASRSTATRDRFLRKTRADVAVLCTSSSLKAIKPQVAAADPARA